MAYFPHPDPNHRAPRSRVTDPIPVEIVVSGSKGVRGTLQAISTTGGCAQLPAVINEGALAEIALGTKFGPVRALAEMLKPQTAGARRVQAFRFIALSETDHERLTSALNSLRESA